MLKSFFAYALAIAVIVVIVFGTFRFVGFIPERAEICKENPYTGQEKCATYPIVEAIIKTVGRFLDDVSVALTAVFTGVVGLFTWRLYRSTDKLWNETKDAGATAREAADAAKESADGIKNQARVAIMARLPVVGWAGAKLIEIKFLEPATATQGDDPVKPGLPPVISQPIAVLKNAGPTNVAIHFMRYRWKIAERLFAPPFYEGQHQVGYFMEITAQWVLPPSIEYITITEEEMADIDAGRRHLWFYGFAQYNDFLDEWHRIRFCFRWDTRSGFVIDGPREYWETEHEKHY